MRPGFDSLGAFSIEKGLRRPLAYCKVLLQPLFSYYANLFLGLGFGKFLVELVDTAVSGNEALLASVEWVAIAAGIDFDVSKGRSGLEGAAAGGAGHDRVVISWVDIFLHFLNSFRRAIIPRTESG